MYGDAFSVFSWPTAHISDRYIQDNMDLILLWWPIEPNGLSTIGPSVKYNSIHFSLHMKDTA